MEVQDPNKFVEFESVAAIKKKTVTGKLRKRAKRYDSQSDSEHSDDQGKGPQKRKKVQMSSMADAFKSIMAKKIDEEGQVQDNTVLVKYKKKERDIEERKAEEDAELKKRQAKERQRLMGRRLPTKDDNEHERELQIIATKGVVQLFNAVAEF